jgi:hypothetical protein
MTYGKHRHLKSETGTEDRSDTVIFGALFYLLIPTTCGLLVPCKSQLTLVNPGRAPDECRK